MLTDQELEGLFADLESDRVERKRSLSDKNRIGEALCAFANDLSGQGLPGVVFVGVEDDGSCAGLPVTDELLRDLAGFRSDGNILPLPMIEVGKRTLNGCEVAVIQVQPSQAPPVRYRGRVWVRIGPRRAQASAEEERRLDERRRARDLTFDVRPLPSATLEDLDLDLFERVYLPSAVSPEVLEENDRSLEARLSSLRLLSTGPGAAPTALGILTVGRRPADFVPGAYVQFLRIDGRELGDPILDDKVLDGPLPELLRVLDETLRVNLRSATDLLAGDREVRSPDYPLVALQQVVRNAILHRDYQLSSAPVRINWFTDRVEIVSPGGAYGSVTRENFGSPYVTDYRNPGLAEVMKNLGYVQKFGYGIPTARREMERNGNPPPRFQVEDSFILVVLEARP